MLTEIQREYQRIYQKKYRSINRERILFQRRFLYEKKYSLNKDIVNENRRARYANDLEYREQKKQMARDYHNNNLDKVKKRRLENKEKRSIQHKDWNERNRENVKQYNITRVDALKDALSDKKCIRHDCERLLTQFQVKCKQKYCSHRCQIIERNRSKLLEIEIPKCANPNCNNVLSRKQTLADRMFCSKECSAVFSNGHVQYNPKACEYFARFDEENSTSGRYATNGGEQFIPQLGYFLDYCNPDKKLIIEWDERHHFNKDGNLKLKDVQRQGAIQKIYPDYQFIRIKETQIL